MVFLISSGNFFKGLSVIVGKLFVPSAIYYFLVVVLMSLSAPLAHAETDHSQCHDAGKYSPFAIYIRLVKTSIKSRQKLASGVFLISNRSSSDSVSFNGHLMGSDDLIVEEPYSELEFKDLNGSWSSLTGPISDGF